MEYGLGNLVHPGQLYDHVLSSCIAEILPPFIFFNTCFCLFEQEVAATK